MYLQNLRLAVFVGLLMASQSSLAVTLFVSGKAGPWNPAINPSLNYAQADGLPDPPTNVIGGLDDFVPWVAGSRITVTYVSGSPLAGANGTVYGVGGLGVPGWPPVVAPCTASPGCYTSEGETYLEQLIGAFADVNGVVVGQPFVVNNFWSGLLPEGASQLLLGFNDAYYADNGDGIVVEVEYDFCETYGGKGQIQQGRLLKNTAPLSANFASQFIFDQTRQYLERCASQTSIASSEECSSQSFYKLVADSVKKANSDLLFLLRSNNLRSVLDARRAGFKIERYPLAAEYLAASNYYSNVKHIAASTLATPTPYSVCGGFGNPLPTTAARRWLCEVSDAKSTLTNNSYHKTPDGIFGGDWTRPQTYSREFCNVGSYRDQAILSKAGNTFFNVQDYAVFAPRGEPNPEIWTYVWPYPLWPLYAAHWHDTH